MKKKLLSFVLAICLIFPLTFTLVSCAFGRSDDGEDEEAQNELSVVLKTESQILEALGTNYHVKLKDVAISVQNNTENVAEYKNVTDLKRVGNDAWLYTRDETTSVTQCQYFYDNIFGDTGEKYRYFYNYTLDPQGYNYVQPANSDDLNVSAQIGFLFSFAGQTLKYKAATPEQDVNGITCTKYEKIIDTDTVYIWIDDVTGATVKRLTTGTRYQSPNFEVEVLTTSGNNLTSEKFDATSAVKKSFTELDNTGLDFTGKTAINAGTWQGSGLTNEGKFKFDYVFNTQSDVNAVFQDFFNAGAKKTNVYDPAKESYTECVDGNTFFAFPEGGASEVKITTYLNTNNEYLVYIEIQLNSPSPD